VRETGSKPTRAEENREREDAMPTVGEILAAERRRQGKSLNDAVEGTKIRSRLLDALENGRFDELPNPAYVKGYIQSYARYLEIPVEPLLDEYRRESATYVYPGRRIDRYLDIPHETIVPERSQAHAIPRNVWVAAAAVLIIAILVVCAISRLFNVGTTNMPASTKTGSSSEVTASPGAEATTTVQESAGSFKVRVTVKKNAASWVQATVDGLVAYDGTLNGGESREWLVNDTAVLKIGKPASVTVTKAGKAVTVPKGTNVRLTLTVNQ
jgi:cytoskeletal protein RodZ